MRNIRYISFCGAMLMAVSLSAGVSVWFGHKDGAVALVVTPRQYIPVSPGGTTGFTAIAWYGDGSQTDVTASASWSCSPAIGTMDTNTLSATNASPVFGVVEGSYGGITNRVHVKVTVDGFWNPTSDFDGDGVSDAAELSNNMSPDRVGVQSVRCRVR